MGLIGHEAHFTECAASTNKRNALAPAMSVLDFNCNRTIQHKQERTIRASLARHDPPARQTKVMPHPRNGFQSWIVDTIEDRETTKLAADKPWCVTLDTHARCLSGIATGSL
jgi:hypothetical protein